HRRLEIAVGRADDHRRQRQHRAGERPLELRPVDHLPDLGELAELAQLAELAVLALGPGGAQPPKVLPQGSVHPHLCTASAPPPRAPAPRAAHSGPGSPPPTLSGWGTPRSGMAAGYRADGVVVAWLWSCCALVIDERRRLSRSCEGTVVPCGPARTNTKTVI